MTLRRRCEVRLKVTSMSPLAELPFAIAVPGGRVESPDYPAGGLHGSDSPRDWEEIRALLADKSRALLALGFDGILSPTVPRPKEAALSDGTRPLLVKLAACPRLALVFLSGRSILDLQARVGLEDAFYVGNFGMETRGPGFSAFDGLAVSCRAELVDALVHLAKTTKRLRGVFIEDKGMTVTVHSRAATPEDAALLRELMAVIVRNHPRLRVCTGEACWDIRARASWTKTDAVRQILSHLHLDCADLIYVGEEFTDGDVFAQIPEALTFCVGSPECAPARFLLPNQSAVPPLLSNILAALSGR